MSREKLLKYRQKGEISYLRQIIFTHLMIHTHTHSLVSKLQCGCVCVYHNLQWVFKCNIEDAYVSDTKGKHQPGRFSFPAAPELMVST